MEVLVYGDRVTSHFNFPPPHLEKLPQLFPPRKDAGGLLPPSD